ncbi:MAG: M48 family metallopeptidase [Burkholderiales bacterium]|nr:M48 family metallopeptidase [Burkholderiales bacterium]
MEPFTRVFLAALVLTYGLRLWLGLRQLRHVWLNRDTVPAAFAGTVSLEEHRRAADYTLAKTRLALVHLAVEAAMLVALTLGGGLQWLHERLADLIGAPLLQGAALLLAMMLVLALAELPLAWYRQFRIEARFGFNRQKLADFVADHLKQALLTLLLGGPLMLLVLWLMGAAGEAWWLWAWFAWMGFNLLVLALYPTLIAPLFNTFTPLADEGLRRRIEGLLARTGFRADGVYVMDGSRRSTHGNAYFTGLGRAKRIVFFDTLLAQLSPEQTEAVLAHELGHYKRHHVAKRIAVLAGVSLLLLWALAWLKQTAGFYSGLGVQAHTDALALALFFLAVPVFLFPLTPLASLYARKHEFEADAFAARYSHPAHLISALVRLYRDNAATLTPDPLYSIFYDTHPRASERIGRLQALQSAAPQPT